MEVFGERANRLAHIGKKGDHIVFRCLLNFIHPMNIEGRLLPYLFRSLRWNHSQFCEGLTGQELDGEPGLESSLIRPNLSHFRASVS